MVASLRFHQTQRHFNMVTFTEIQAPVARSFDATQDAGDEILTEESCTEQTSPIVLSFLVTFVANSFFPASWWRAKLNSQVEKLSRSASWKNPPSPSFFLEFVRKIAIWCAKHIHHCYMMWIPHRCYLALCRQMEFHDDLVPATPRNLEEGKFLTWDVKDVLGLIDGLFG